MAHHGDARRRRSTLTRVSVGPAPSSLTASAPASLTKRIAFSSASVSETWNEPNGMSAITSGRRAPRVTARVSTSISSIVAGTRGVVAEDRHRRRVAHEDEVGAGLVGEAAGRRVVRRDHDDRLAPRLHAGELGDGELAGGGRAGCGGARACAHDSSSSGTLSIRRVVPTRTAAASVGGSNGASGDVVDLEAGCVEDRPRRVVGVTAWRARGAARALARAPPAERRTLRDESASPSVSRTVAHDLERELEVQVGDHPADHLDLLGVLLPEERDIAAGRW